MIRRKRPNSLPNFGEKPLQFSAKIFFLVFIQFRRRNYVIFTKVLTHAKCVWLRGQKRPPIQNSIIEALPTTISSLPLPVDFKLLA